MTNIEQATLAATESLSPTEIQLAVGLLHASGPDIELHEGDRARVLGVLLGIANYNHENDSWGAITILLARNQRGEYMPPATVKKLWGMVDAAGLRNEVTRVLHWHARLMRLAHHKREQLGIERGSEPPDTPTLH